MNDEEKKDKEKKEEKPKYSWFQKVPVLYKVLGLGLIVVQYLGISNRGGSTNEIWIWVIIVLAVWYFIGSGGLLREGSILTPVEAETKLGEEIERKIREKQIPRSARIFIGPNNGLFHHEGLPVHYIISIEILDKGIVAHKRGIVFAEGNTKGYVTIQDFPGKVTGREAVPLVSPIPHWMRRADRAGLDIDKYVFGEKK